MKLVNSISAIHTRLLPKLIGLAARFSHPNPEDCAREWLYRAYIIARSVDDGKAMDSPTDASGLPLAPGSQAFFDSFSAYLLRCYKNDLISDWKKRKRTPVSADDLVMELLGSCENESPLLSAGSTANAKDLMRLVQEDLAQLNSEHYPKIRQAVKIVFLQAISLALNDASCIWEENPIIYWAYGKSPPDCTDQDFLRLLYRRTQYHLACLTSSCRSSPMLFCNLASMVCSSGNQAIELRVARYLFRDQENVFSRLSL